MNYQAWEECRKSLELELNQDEFSTWISPLAYSEEQDEFGMQAVTLLAPNDFIKEHVKQNYDSIIKQYLSRSLDSENLSLNYDLFNSPKPLITKDKSKKIPFLDDKENSKAKLHSTFSGTLIIINELDHIPASILDLISIVSFLLVFLGTKISKALLICDNMTRDISFF